MVYWKIDDETIRCLINEDEIGKMGFDLELLKTGDRLALGEFLEAIIDDSHNYIEWNTENGIQNFAARALPASQYLLTISCTFKDDAIDRDLVHMKNMINNLDLPIPMERITEVEQLDGDKKEQAFIQLSKDLHEICTGKLAEELRKMKGRTETPKENTSGEVEIEEIQEIAINGMKLEDIPPLEDTLNKAADQAVDSTGKKDVLPAQKITFHSMNQLLVFTSLLEEGLTFHSDLYRCHGEYILLVDFDVFDDNVDIITFMITAEEFGAKTENQGYAKYYLQEHGELLIKGNAIEVLNGFHLD